MSAIQYRISASNLNAHIFTVSIEIPAHSQTQLTLRLPSWLPGSYMIRDFAKNIVQLSAVYNKRSINTQKLDKQTWQIETDGQAVRVEYQVYAFDLSVRTAFLDNQRGFFNGSSTFLEIVELADMKCDLEIIAPKNCQNWKVATGLPRAKATDIYQFGHYHADNYQHLIDCPVELGDFDVIEFSVANVPHYLVFAGRHFGDKQRLKQDISKLCQHHIDLFGEAPFSEYWFITNLLGNGFGGLEHKNSTVLVASRFDLPNPNTPNELSENYKTFLSLCSHEYFHAWNVCRIKPAEFVPYNLSKEVHTTQLWAYEGITSYYDDFSLFRSGIINFDEYLALLAKTMSRVYRGQGELKQSVAESSFDTWTKFYKQGPDAVNNIVSYYTKGSLIALWLDLTIRNKTQQQHSLDSLMRILWTNHGKVGKGTQEQDFIDAVNQLCQDDLTAQFNQLLHTASRVDLVELLHNVGVDMQQVAYSKLNAFIPNTNNNQPPRQKTTEKSHPYRPYIGAFYKQVSNGLKITVIEENSPAENAGLSVDDIIIAVDNIKVCEKTLPSLLNHLTINCQVNCHIFRDDSLLNRPITILNDPKLAIALTIYDENKSKTWQRIL